MYSEDTLLRLVEDVYDAAVAPERWPEFLETLADVIDGHIVNLAWTSTCRTQTTMSFAVRFDPDANRRYLEHYCRLDPWANAAAEQGLFRTGVVGLGAEIVAKDVYERSEFYNDFGRACGLSGGISAVIRADASGSALLNASQRPQGRRFDESDVLLLRRLLPHLQRAFHVHERLSEVTLARSTAEEVIHRLPFGAVLFDRTGHVAFVNRAARQMFDACDGLSLRGKAVFTSTIQQTAELHESIAQALGVSRGEGLYVSTDGVLSINRPSLKRPFQVLVTPIRTAALGLTLSLTGPMAAMFISDPQNEPVTPDVMLRTFYGLTPAEARLAAQLLQHRSVEEAADVLQISLNTARTHVKKLFEKTGTRRQSELVRLLGSGVGRLQR